MEAGGPRGEIQTRTRERVEDAVKSGVLEMLEHDSPNVAAVLGIQGCNVSLIATLEVLDGMGQMIDGPLLTVYDLLAHECRRATALAVTILDREPPIR